MNKALHVFVYLFVILAGACLWFEFQLYQKRELLTERNHIQEDFLIKIAGTIEKEEPNKDAIAEIKKDVSPVEAKIVDSPDTENVLEDYKFYLEQQQLPTYDWKNDRDIEELRHVYVLDAQGKVEMDGNRKKTWGPGTEFDKLSAFLDACSHQQAKLNMTRQELVVLHKKLDAVVEELNELKPIARQDKVTIVEKNEKIAKLESEKADLENQIVKIKAQIDELNAEITSLKDEVVTAHDETEAAKEDLAKSQKMVENLKKLLADAMRQINGGGNRTDTGNMITSIPAGDKGRIVEADNDSMFAIVEFTPEAMKQLKGDDLSRPLPVMEFGVKRDGFQGEAGEFVGRLRLRQEITGKNYIICDILSNWEQDKLQPNDVIFAD